MAHQSSDFKNSKTPIGYHDQGKPEFSPIKICICDKTGVPIGKSKEYKQSSTNNEIRRHKRKTSNDDLIEIIPKNTG